MSLKLHTIICSTRPGRGGKAVAEWFHGVAQQHGRFDAQLVDLATFNLPVYDEPLHPRLQKYEHAHTRAWAESVDAADAYVFVTPEYNFSTPPSLMNALNFVYKEWNYKPVAFVSYGGVSGGLRSVQMTKQVGHRAQDDADDRRRRGFELHHAPRRWKNIQAKRSDHHVGDAHARRALSLGRSAQAHAGLNKKHTADLFSGVLERHFLSASLKLAHQGSVIQFARTFLGDRHGVSSGSRVLRRHLGHLVESCVVDLQAGQRMRHAELLAASAPSRERPGSAARGR